MEFGIHGNASILLLEASTSTPVLYLPEVLFSNIHLEGVYTKASGGEQNMQLLGWNDSAAADFLINTPVFSMKFLELAAGSSLQTTTEPIYQIDILELDTENKAELNFQPLATKPFFVFELNVSGRQVVDNIVEADFTLNDQEITIDKDIAGDWILVYYYYTSEIEKVKIGKFINQGYFKILGQTIIYNQDTGEEEVLKFEFPRVNIRHQFNINMLNANNPEQVFTMFCTAIADDSKDKMLAKIFKPIV